MKLNRRIFMHKDFISIHDFTVDEIKRLAELTKDVKKNPSKYETALKGKTLGMIFQKSSTRTRVSFEVGIYQLGGIGLFLSSNDIQLGRGETIPDTAKVLSRYLDGIMARVFAHTDITDLAENATVPVINGLTDLLHPCQVMADFFTIKENFGETKGLKVVYIGDGNNMAHSLMYGAAKFGSDITIISPSGYTPDKTVVKQAEEDAKQTGSRIVVTEDIETGVKDANVVYTDVWASMGQEAEANERKKKFVKYQVNEKLMKMADKNAIFLHCLPAKRGLEVTGEVLDAPYSKVIDEAENRLHAQKAIMLALMSKKYAL
jgi:ornithine carbamoyltransferase